MSSNLFDHFVITRFNVRVNAAALADEWLRHRLHYFKTVCCQAMAKQTNRNFRWLVLFDSMRSPWFDEQVSVLSASGLFEPIWIEGTFTGEAVASVVAERSTAPWLITTRVDNDDAIARDYVELVQSHFAKQEFEFVNFQRGVQLTESGELFHRADPSSPFLSLIEKRSRALPATVYVWAHSEVEKNAKLRQINSHPMWLQMIHSRNVSNQVRGVRADPRIVSRYFDIDQPATAMSRHALALSSVSSFMLLTLRVIRKPRRLVWLGKVIWNRAR